MSPTSSRRSFLTAIGTAGVVSLAGCLAPPPSVTDGGGGGLGVGNMPTARSVEPEDAEETVTTADALVREATRGSERIIWIPSDVQIDLTGRSFITRNVIASGRGGEEGENGALLFTETKGVNSPSYKGGAGFGVIQMEAGARLTGVRFRGPTYDFWDSLNGQYPGYLPYLNGESKAARFAYYDRNHARGLSMVSTNTRVDNCEIFGWPTQGILVGNSSEVASPMIHHCAFHNNMMTSAGYAIEVYRGFPKILNSYFDAHRHAIAGFGYPDCSYLIQGCTFGPHTSSHWIDQHGLHDNLDKTSSNPSSDIYKWRAGGTMIVKGCVFLGTHVIPDATFGNAGNMTPVTHVRGVPLDGYYFTGNRVAHSSPLDAHKQSSAPNPDEHGFQNFYEGENEYGIPTEAVIGTAKQAEVY